MAGLGAFPRPQLTSTMRSATIRADAETGLGAEAVLTGHSLPYPLAIALSLAIGGAIASGWEPAREFAGRTGIDPIDALSFGGYWESRLVAGSVAAVVASLMFGLVARRVGHRVGIVAVPRLWRLHARPTPILGSMAIFAGMSAGVLVGAPHGLGSRKLAAAVVGAIAMGTLGFLDDLKGLTPRTRLLATAVVTEIAWVLGLRAEAFPTGALGDVANSLLTMVWFVGVTHAFNVFDNMDGASAGVALASSLSIAALAAVTNQGVVVVVGLAIAGGCLGYLAHNFFPARLYMGDSGALMLGFAVAALGLMLEPPVARPLGFALPVLAVGVPIFDTAMVTISRMQGRRRVAIGGTDHMTHRLHNAGFGVRAVVPFLFLAQLTLGGMAIVVASVPRAAGWATVVLTGCAGLMTLLLFLRLPEWRPESELAADADLTAS